MKYNIKRKKLILDAGLKEQILELEEKVRNLKENSDGSPETKQLIAKAEESLKKLKRKENIRNIITSLTAVAALAVIVIYKIRKQISLLDKEEAKVSNAESQQVSQGGDEFSGLEESIKEAIKNFSKNSPTSNSNYQSNQGGVNVPDFTEAIKNFKGKTALNNPMTVEFLKRVHKNHVLMKPGYAGISPLQNQINEILKSNIKLKPANKNAIVYYKKQAIAKKKRIAEEKEEKKYLENDVNGIKKLTLNIIKSLNTMRNTLKDSNESIGKSIPRKIIELCKQLTRHIKEKLQNAGRDFDRSTIEFHRNNELFTKMLVPVLGMTSFWNALDGVRDIGGAIYNTFKALYKKLKRAVSNDSRLKADAIIEKYLRGIAKLGIAYFSARLARNFSL